MTPLNLLIVCVPALWILTLALRLIRSRLYWLTFWVLVVGLPVLAIYWFSTPWPAQPNANFGAGMPSEYVYGIFALALWLIVLVLELIVFIVLKVRGGRNVPL